MTKKPRLSHMTPFILSACVAPGAGQFYRRKYLKGFLMLGGCLIGFVWLFVDLVSVVNASLQVDPLLQPADIVEKAMEIRRSLNLETLRGPILVIVAAYVWGVIDALWMEKARKSSAPDGSDHSMSRDASHE